MAVFNFSKPRKPWLRKTSLRGKHFEGIYSAGILIDFYARERSVWQAMLLVCECRKIHLRTKAEGVQMKELESEIGFSTSDQKQENDIVVSVVG